MEGQDARWGRSGLGAGKVALARGGSGSIPVDTCGVAWFLTNDCNLYRATPDPEQRLQIVTDVGAGFQRRHLQGVQL